MGLILRRGAFSEVGVRGKFGRYREDKAVRESTRQEQHVCARAYVSYSRLRFKNFNLSFSGVANWQGHGVMDLI